MAPMDQLNRLEEVMLHKIGQMITSRTTEEQFVAKALKFHDLSNAGWVDFEKFKRAMAPYSVGVGDQDLRAIFSRYAQENMLPIRQFASEFVHGDRRAEDVPLPSAQPQEVTDSSPEETLMRLKDFLFENGPRGITSLAAAFRDADAQNSRVINFDTFQMVMSEFFQESPCQFSDEQLDHVFELFLAPNSAQVMAYDEFFLALTEEPNQQRRASIRQAFRRLDGGSEGLVDANLIISSYNANRHPDVSAGRRQPEEVRDEFAETLKDHVGYRRGQRSYPTNLIAWEEFEDYYKSISGCYVSDEEFCSMMQKVWDLNKIPDASVESRAALARPAAGAPAKSRAGLHHWQTNTLTTSPTHHKVDAFTKIEDVLLRARGLIARKGIRAAVDVVQNFYEADDDVDDEIDVYEFRSACQKSGIAFRDAEEVSLFNAVGSQTAGKMNLPQFLRQLHGELSPRRRAVVEKAFAALGGIPEDPESAVSPQTLKECFAAQAHPLVLQGQLEPGYVLAEFLDTFSQLAHVLGGCENGMVHFSDFLAYYEVVSSTIDNDTLFDLILQRVWDVPSQDTRTPKEAWGEKPMSPRRQVAITEVQPTQVRAASPMRVKRPPAHQGPSAYSKPGRSQNGQELDASVQESHRRFGRMGDGAPICSPITKSSIVFDQAGHGQLGGVILRLRKALALRGLKGWQGFVQRFQHYDYRRNGTAMRLDWQRIAKNMGLGLSPDEQELIYKALSQSKKGTVMDYVELLGLLRGHLDEERSAAVDNLFQALGNDDVVAKQTLMARFDARSSPQCLLKRKDPRKAEEEFLEVIDFFVPGADLDENKFNEFFSMVSAVHEDDDEFRLMTSSAFGL
eukprot:TRINITY_DN1922_c0_g2_i1.p1 TRINITY_DN1922_c0_g2~~TRINITY_DN1922_c0_g2_i1.p1  ORF type:complete len:874 (-),score=184.20 TRINITY_DN1922_c0_g2_i1:60-2606(-)